MSEAIIATGITTIGVIVTTIIQTRQARKKDDIEKKLEEIKMEFKTDITSLKTDIQLLKENADIETLNRCKYDLVTSMTEIKLGAKPTIEKVRLLKETKELYNSKGGDSYVDDMYEDLRKEGKL